MAYKYKNQSYGIDNVLLPTQVIVLIAEVLKEQGLDETELLTGTGLPDSLFHQPNSQIRYDQVLQIIENALAICPFPGLGLTVGARENITSWGLLGFVMMTAPDLQTAVNLGSRYLIAGPATIEIQHYMRGDEYCIEAYSPIRLGRLLPFVTEELFSAIYTCFSAILDKPFIAKEIHLSYAEPDYSEKYSEFFGCPVHFDAPGNYLLFDPKYLSLPLVTANEVSSQLCISLCEDYLASQQGVTDICYLIRRILVRTPNIFPNMEQVADELKMSVRSLRRQLAERDTSFQKMLDEVRKDIAIQLLESSNIPLTDIAERLGFSEYNNFRKAFKRWTGSSPACYRGGKPLAF